MKKISLSGGKAYALVDDEDYELLSQFRWYVDKNGYAWAMISMHRCVMRPKFGEPIDHIDGDTINNQKNNLRHCSYRQNAHNRRVQDNTSGFKGVAFMKKRNTSPWQAHIYYGGKRHSLGYFREAREAAVMYDFWATLTFGEYAKTNFKVVASQTAS
jgi:hypothetical protein